TTKDTKEHEVRLEIKRKPFVLIPPFAPSIPDQRLRMCTLWSKKQRVKDDSSSIHKVNYGLVFFE
ncbi:MAG TPA: hypothetical protein PKC66_22970, partial [Leptospiraceae bacterium]|nr:hypothetical protein [Leptospiraceae bacterium]HNH01998.1 hypothetical protein [Leptospiraceae bacterium]HNK94953.1 hypothetical protein [Leptospiraceae bacterium]HNL74701.1 hypothetical protein [Leptospiraceae bacterium]HNM91884.1 hypothetical protein [Leptospiraceae bacterium]